MITKLEIYRGDNGFILKHKDGDETILRVVEETDGQQYIVSLLYAILEHFGEVGSKHDCDRVRVIRVNQEGKELCE